MDLINKYAVFVGSSRGTVTYTNLDAQSKIQFELAKEPSEISSMIWGRTEHEIITGFENGNICVYDTNQRKYTELIDSMKNKGTIVGLGCMKSRIISGSSKGTISILGNKGMVETIETISIDESTLGGFAQNSNKSSIFATGGEMNDLKLWDIDTKQCVFKAKSLGHDYLNLPIKTSIRGITFIPEENNICCCVTKEGHILLYDDRAQRKPVVKYFEQKASFTTIAPAYRQRNILAGTTKGFIQYVDMKAGKCLKTFTGITGSVSCLMCDPVEPVLFTTSIDRHLRIFDLNTKQVLHQRYLKQNLTKILMKPIIKEESEDLAQNQKSCEDVEYEEIFEKMEVITEKSSKKRNPFYNPKAKSKKLKK